MLSIKSHRIKGKVSFLQDKIIIDDGRKKDIFLISDIIDIKFKINEYEGEPRYVIPVMVKYNEGLYNYLEISSKSARQKHELFITKPNIRQLNYLFGLLNGELKDRISIYQESRKVKELSL